MQSSAAGGGNAASNGARNATGMEATRKRTHAELEQSDADGPVRRGIFGKDLPGMMYGFGDGAKPRQETVDLVEDMVIEYVSTLLEKAVDMAAFRGKLKYEDFVWQVADEPYKLERLKELLEKNEEIKKARKVDLDKSDLAALGSREKEANEEFRHDKL